jgi:hypothetical protein
MSKTEKPGRTAPPLNVLIGVGVGLACLGLAVAVATLIQTGVRPLSDFSSVMLAVFLIAGSTGMFVGLAVTGAFDRFVPWLATPSGHSPDILDWSVKLIGWTCIVIFIGPLVAMQLMDWPYGPLLPKWAAYVLMAIFAVRIGRAIWRRWKANTALTNGPEGSPTNVRR